MLFINNQYLFTIAKLQNHRSTGPICLGAEVLLYDIHFHNNNSFARSAESGVSSWEVVSKPLPVN